MTVALVRASETDRSVLENLLHLYVHDFSEILGMTPSEEGRFEYPSLPLYWSESGRTAYFIRSKSNLAGFALVSRGSRISGDPEVFDLAEFFVVRGVRRRGVGRTAAHELFRSVPGIWEVRVNEVNVPAQHFWRRVVDLYTDGQFHFDTWVREDGSRWNVFRFTSSNPIRS
jgi:predicted acetyltransferase